MNVLVFCFGSGTCVSGRASLSPRAPALWTGPPDGPGRVGAGRELPPAAARWGAGGGAAAVSFLARARGERRVNTTESPVPNLPLIASV